MPDFTLYFILIISFGTVLSIVISYNNNHSILLAILHGLLSWVYVVYIWLFLYGTKILNSIKSFLFKKLDITDILYLLWIIGIAVAIFILTMIWIFGFDDIKSIAPLVGAFAILISAGIASASVMKSIAETKANETKKHEKEDSKFYLDKCVSYLEHVLTILGKLQNDLFSWRDASETLIIMRDLSKKITEESHKEVFKAEYTKYRMRLYSSFATAKKKDDKFISIDSPFFCGVEKWEDKKLEEAFNENEPRILPEHLICVLKFAHKENNHFLEDETDYKEWRSLDLTKINEMPLKIAIDYINMYKEKISVETKAPE